MTDEVVLSFETLDGYRIINMETCTRCAACAQSCPAYAATKDDSAIPAWKGIEFRKLVNRQRGFLSALLGHRSIPRQWLRDISEKGLYLCTLCGRCMPGCVFNIQNLELWESLRSIIFKKNEHPPSLKGISTSLEQKKNPYDSDPDERLAWVNELGPANAKMGERAQTLYYVGCTSSYQEKGIASSTSTVLNKMNEDWSLFGRDEWCCGDPHLAVGDQDKAREFARHNLEIASSLGAKRIVTGCAHCYRMWKWRYPELLDRRHNLEILHTTEYLQECLKSGKLKIDTKLPGKLTYHDPCYLSRLGGIVSEPRNILCNIASNYVELKEKAFDTYCCGGGAMTEAVNRELWAKIGGERIRQVKMVNPEFLISACPFCRRSFTQANQRTGSHIQVLDITELVARQLKD